MARSCSMLVLYALMGISLALHVVTIGGALMVRGAVKEELSTLADQMASAELQTIHVDVKLKQDIPVSATFPIQKSVVIPVNTTVNIDQVIAVPINTPLGTATINVPLKTSVPINTTVPVSISDTLTVNTTVNLDVTVPVNIAVADTPFVDLLRTLRKHLTELNQKF